MTTTKMTPEQLEQERQEMRRIFTRKPGGELNTEAIALLIGWAEEDVNLLARWRSLDLWGRWDQGTWGSAELPANEAGVTLHEDEWGTSLDDKDEAREEVDKAVLNGACQTAFCMAGQAVSQAGYRLIFDDVDLEGMMLTGTAEYCVRAEPTGVRDNRGHMTYRDVGDPTNISSKAASILGLGHDEQQRFFSGSNTIDDLKEMANDFCADRGLARMYPEAADLPF